MAKKRKKTPIRTKPATIARRKGHLEATCWEKYPEKMPKKVKAARSKVKSKGSKKTSFAMAAI